MENLSGIYIVLGVGSALAFVYGIVIWFYYIHTKARHYQLSIREVFVEELKFALDFNSYTRVLKNTASMYSRGSNSIPSVSSTRDHK